MTRRRGPQILLTVIAAASSIVALAAAASGQGAASQNIELPPFRGMLRDDYYPADARLHFRQGRALLEFSVDAHGVPTDVVLVNSDPAREFDDAARMLARHLRYQVPPDWEQGAAARRFRLGVRFQVVECVNFSHCEPNARNPPADYDVADRTYVLTAQKHVVVLLNQGPRATPSAASPAAPSEEPVYPPG